jgi:mono/diheme cytochrome c family protein
MNMRDGRFVGNIIALALGAILVVVAMRFLGYGIGVSEATELDWSTCEVEGKLNPRGGPLHDIRCDDTIIIYEVLAGISSARGATGSVRQVQGYMHKEDLHDTLKRSFEFSNFRRANEELQSVTQGTVVNGFVSDVFVLTDINKEQDDVDEHQGKGLMSVILNGDRGYIALCVSRTKTRELCEGAIVDLFEAKDTPLLVELEQVPAGVVAELDEPRVDEGDDEGGEVVGKEAAPAEEVAVPEPTAEERAALRKRGQEFYLSQCASCHNVGMSRAPSAPKVGEPYWRGALSRDIDDVVEAAKSKCKDERDGGPFSHALTDAEISAAAHHAMMKSAR